MDDLGIELRYRIARYLSGRDSFDRFQTWFAAATWDTHAIPDPETRGLASWTTLRIAEFTNGHWTEPQLKLQLASLMRATGPANVQRTTFQAPRYEGARSPTPRRSFTYV